MTNSASKRSRLRPLFTLAIAACAAGAIYLGIGYYVYLQLARGTYGHGADDGNTPAGFHLNGDAYPDFDVTSYLCPDYQDVVIAGGDPGGGGDRHHPLSWHPLVQGERYAFGRSRDAAA